MSLRRCYPVFQTLLKSIKPDKSQQSCVCISGTFKTYQRIFSTQNPPETVVAPKQIYYGILTPQIKAVKFFSLSSSFVGIVAQPFLYNAVVSSGSVPLMVAAYSFIGFFTFVTPFLLHLITKKYVTHLEYKPNTDTYVAKTINFIGMTKETEFKPDDVKVPDVPGMFTSFVASGRPMFIDPRLFENPHHYARIMGFDKPIDFKLYESPPDAKKE